MSKLVGKVAVVTGASKGIGAAIVKSLAGAGVLPDWTAHRGDVRCGGRPHGQSSTEGGRTAGV
jgi:NAD(P)-dependent dehydrogenase (short-subunit alcohol dehydrogenase family)